LIFNKFIMQGKKEFTPKMFYNLSLDSLVPADDFHILIFHLLLFYLLF